MKIQKVIVKNFRALKDFKLDFERDISLIVGKNNCGKTSVVTIMDKLLGTAEAKFSWNDFNLKFQNEFYRKLQNYTENSEETNFDIKGIKMQVFVEYTEDDNYENIQMFMMNLEPKNNIVVLEFFYSCKEDKFKQLRKDINDLNLLENKFEEFSKYMSKNVSKYFSLNRYSREFDVYTNETTNNISDEINVSMIRKLISIKIIKADREASNKQNDNTLSELSQKYYNIQYDNDKIDLNGLQKAIYDADILLSDVYNGNEENEGIFKQIFKSVKRFGSETNLTIQSSISERELLKNNTTLYYKSDNCQLPENYNGLGYLNLIGMIIEIETSIAEFCVKENKRSSDINIIFIEEPEAHAHPQLQYVFIKNIKKLLAERKEYHKINLQTVITTHSSHIVSECDFNDICYLKRVENNVVSKNFKELKKKYNSEQLAFKFIKQYLNLNRSELFFVDKIIFIEGDTERILLPAMMEKFDLKNNDKEYIPLLSQNISIIEAGAYAYIFRHFIEFLGVKALIITDIDGVIDNGGKACASKYATYTSNQTLRDFFDLPNDNTQFEILLNKNSDDKIIDINTRIAYQTEIQIDGKTYQPRSFEDSFICLNIDYIKSNKDEFKQGLKNRDIIGGVSPDFYEISDKCIAKKSALATEILYYDCENDGKTWKVPNYIEEGLNWLQKQ